MMRRFAGLAVAVLLVVAGSAAAQQEGISGSVLRVDPSAHVIVLEDGRMLQTGPQTVIVTGGQPTAFDTLQAGTPVTVYSAQPVMFRDGQYAPLTVTTPTVTSSAYPSTSTVQPLPPTFYEASGTLAQADATSHRLRFADGRTIGLTKDTQVIANGQPAMIVSTLKPGTPIVVRSVTPFSGADKVSRSQEAAIASGTVVRVDQGNTVVFSDGRVVRTTPDNVIVVDNQPVALSSVQPGNQVVIYDNGTAAALPRAVLDANPLTVQGGLRQWENEIQAP